VQLILDRHCGYQYHPGQYRLPAVSVIERAKPYGEGGAADQQQDLQGEKRFQGRSATS
jgi:hypothetical protein